MNSTVAQSERSGVLKAEICEIVLAAEMMEVCERVKVKWVERNTKKKHCKANGEANMVAQIDE